MEPQINSYPFVVKYLPRWFPGATFKKIAREWRETLYTLTDDAYDYVIGQMVSVNAPVRCLELGLLMFFDPLIERRKGAAKLHSELVGK